MQLAELLGLAIIFIVAGGLLYFPARAKRLRENEPEEISRELLALAQPNEIIEVEWKGYFIRMTRKEEIEVWDQMPDNVKLMQCRRVKDEDTEVVEENGELVRVQKPETSMAYKMASKMADQTYDRGKASVKHGKKKWKGKKKMGIRTPGKIDLPKIEVVDEKTILVAGKEWEIDDKNLPKEVREFLNKQK